LVAFPFPLDPVFSMYFDHCCLKVCHFFVSSFMGIWLFAGSASIYVFLRFVFHHFFSIPLGYLLFRIGQLGPLCMIIGIIMEFSCLFYFYSEKMDVGWFLYEFFNSLYLFGGFVFFIHLHHLLCYLVIMCFSISMGSFCRWILCCFMCWQVFFFCYFPKISDLDEVLFMEFLSLVMIS